MLPTGVALPAEPSLLARYAADLAGAGVSALAVELGRRYVGTLPPALVCAAAESGLTLIAFEREVPFVEITEAVHARIIDAQLEELRASERLHEVFTELSVAGASPDEIVRQAAILAGRPVILEPGPAGSPDADHRHHQPGPRRPGRSRCASQGARGAGRRPSAHRHGAQAARPVGTWGTRRFRARAGARRRRHGGRRVPRRAHSLAGRNAG